MTALPEDRAATAGKLLRRSPFLDFTIGCSHPDADDLEPGPDGDRACGDCRAEWAGLDDGGAWRSWAYAA